MQFTPFKRAVSNFGEDDCTTFAASLAYYTVFAMPPLLFLLVSVLTYGMALFVEDGDARQQAERFLQEQAASLIGDQAAATEIGNILDNLQEQTGGWWKSLLSMAGVIVGATGLVAAIQTALNRVWRVEAPGGSFAMQLLLKRLFSLAMILGFGFLLIVSFVISTTLNILGDYAAEYLGMGNQMPFLINQSVSFLLAWAFFSFILRFMPDAEVSWRDAMLGGLVTVLLFTLGRLGLYFYLDLSNPAEKLGSAAASLVVILLWVYYSSICLLFGAEVTANLSRPNEA